MKNTEALKFLELHESIFFYKEHDIEYVAFTNILQAIGFNDGCWNNNQKVVG